MLCGCPKIPGNLAILSNALELFVVELGYTDQGRVPTKLLTRAQAQQGGRMPNEVRTNRPWRCEGKAPICMPTEVPLTPQTNGLRLCASKIACKGPSREQQAKMPHKVRAKMLARAWDQRGAREGTCTPPCRDTLLRRW